MIYSVHNPVTGLFDYFEGGPDTPLNDDLPTPQLPRNRNGVAASAAGRPLPPGVRSAGSGVLPVGSISSGESGLWTGSGKTGMPSGLSGLLDDTANEFTSGVSLVLTVSAVGCVAAAALAEDSEQRWKWGIISAAAAAWPLWRWYKSQQEGGMI